MIKIWDAAAGVCLMDLEGHDNWIRDIVLHPSGGYLISVADDKTIRIWSTEETQRCRVIANAHEHFIYSVGKYFSLRDNLLKCKFQTSTRNFHMLQRAVQTLPSRSGNVDEFYRSN